MQPPPAFAHSDLFDVNGRVALVTGGSGGIGLMMARALIENGARVYICARSRDQLYQAASDTGAIAIQADISTSDGIETVRSCIAAAESRLDILINNAGTSWVAPIEEFPESGWDKVFALNTRAPFFLVKALLPLLSREEDEVWSRVIMISSARGSTAESSSVAYNASKASLDHMTRTLARSLAGRHVTVNAVAPGWFETDLNRTVLEDRKEQLLSRQPIKRLGTEEDMAGAVLFLCSRAGAYVTGNILALDGGIIGCS